MSSLVKLKKDLRALADKSKVSIYQNFFKTGVGEYGEGDVFLGTSMPNLRLIAKKYKGLEKKHLEALLNSKIHEERMCSLIILVNNYEKSKSKESKKEIVSFYLSHMYGINNWDLVDISAHKILGQSILDGLKPRTILYKLAKSKNLWEKRIAIISTFQFIRNNKFQDTLELSKILLNDKHDLIHKAVGWMLREVGNRDINVLESFLKTKYKKMPRTMLRYAIEKFPENKRKAYLKGKI